MLCEIDQLYLVLGETPPVPHDHAAALCNFDASLDGHDPFRVSTPTPGGRTPSAPMLFASTSSSPGPSQPTEADHQRVFALFSARLAQVEADGAALTPAEALAGVEPTPALAAWATRTLEHLLELKARREAEIQGLYDALEALWARLGVPADAMAGFVEAHEGSTAAVVAAYEDELARMEGLKRERMGVFVANARAEITALWDELMVSPEERADYAPFYDGEIRSHLFQLMLNWAIQTSARKNSSRSTKRRSGD
jgi:protein regulator of cytokinesis 1